MSSPNASNSSPSEPSGASPAPPAATPAAKSRRRRRGWRWLLYTLCIIGVLAAILICVVQIVLWSSTPRNLAMTLIEQKLGIRAGADTLSTTWFGRTTLTDVRFALPLAGQPFIKIPKVIVHHRWLTSLAITHDIGIRSIELDQPTLHVRRDSLGRWNMQDLADMLTNAIGPASATAPANSPTVQLPLIRIIGATIEVSDAAGKSISIGPVDVVGTPRSAVTWHFTVTVPDHLAIDGMLAPGGLWRQQIEISAKNIRPWLTPWFNRFPVNAQIAAHWAGQLANTRTGASLTGLLLLGDLSANRLHLRGTADMAIGADALTLHPRSLVLTTSSKFFRRADVIGGTAQLANGIVSLQNLDLQLFDGPAKLNASYNLSAGTGRLDAAWDRLSIFAGVSNSGTFTAALTRPFPQSLRLDTNIDSNGAAPGGPYAIKCGLTADGSDWTNFKWQANAPALAWQRIHPLDLSGLQMAGSMRGDTLTLDSIARHADPGMFGYGWFNFHRKNWSILLAGSTWPFHPARGITFGFHLDASGDRQMVRLRDFTLRPSKNGEVVLSGNYVYAIPKPVSLDMRVRHVSDPANPSVLDGQLEGSAHLSGTIWPRQIDVIGQLHGANLAVGTHHLGTVGIRISGTVNEEMADIQTERLSLLGGQGEIEGIYSFAGDALDIGLTVRDLSLADAGRLIGRQDCSGTVGGHWHLFLPELSLDPERVRGTGLFQASDVAIGDLASADQVDAQTTLEHGILRVQPITMLHGNTGHGAGDLAIDLSKARELRGSLTLTDWPVELLRADGKLNVNLHAPNFTIDLPTTSAKFGMNIPRLELKAAMTLQDKPVGHIQILASSTGRVADLQQMDVSLLDGTVNGQAHLDLDQFSRSTARIDWQKLDTAAIARFEPALAGLSGRITGSCVLEPATGMLALEPVALHLHTDWTDGRYKSITLNTLKINAFANHTPEYSRIVLADDPAEQSQLAMAGGTVTFWARCRVESTGKSSRPFTSFLAQVGFSRLSFNQLLHVIAPKGPAEPGIVGGNFMLLANSPPTKPPTSVKPIIRDSFDIFAAPAPHPASQPGTHPASKPGTHPRPLPKAKPIRRPNLDSFLNRFYGEAHANITDSDLINLGPFQLLYNLMHADFGASAAKPTGYGDIDLRLESGNLSITNLRYFNRGTEIDALATISHVANLPDSKLAGTAIGSSRPLSQIKLPLFSDVDKIMEILQQGLTSVVLSGTVRDYKFNPALFQDFGSEMKNYLLGNAEKNSGH